MTFDVFNLCKGCHNKGKDISDGYPVCKHKEAALYSGDAVNEDDLDEDYHPPIVCLSECPLGRWSRPTGIDAVPKEQRQLL